MLIKKKLVILSTLVLFLSFDIFSQTDFFTETNDIPNEQLQENFTIIMSENNLNLDPHTSSLSSEAQIFTGLYEGLFSYDPSSLEPNYALATNYKISRDKKRWTFTIRDNAKFSDGTPITAYSVKDSWLALLRLSVPVH